MNSTERSLPPPAAAFTDLYKGLRQQGYTRQGAFQALAVVGLTFGQCHDAHRAYEAQKGPGVVLTPEPAAAPVPALDVEVTGLGESVVRFVPLTDEARAWFDAFVESESWQHLGPALCVDARYAAQLLHGLAEHGLQYSLSV